ncbi:dihydrolipoyllysine-residue succinyltransferase component of 2-oxoglutarate dehydrogenase complex [Spirochaetia bacterium]|nr:dihydrolipoyllysine-residue succinyltransferase component of 2-oxoglutarate dehydrogenase complex [Spirochaetia bacterium]
MAHVLIMPRQGNTVESCIIGEWKVKEGDTVGADSPVCIVETDKATFEIPAGAAGTVLKILAEAGDDVPVLQPIMVIGNPGEAWEGAVAGSAAAPQEAAVPQGAAAVPAQDASAGPGQAQAATPSAATQSALLPGEHIAVSKRAKKLAESEAVDLRTIPGTGPEGRIIEADVAAAIAGRPPLTAAAKDELRRRIAEGGAVPAGPGSGIGGRLTLADVAAGAASGATAPGEKTAAAQAGEYTDTPIKGIRRIIADQMMSSHNTTAAFTLNASVTAVPLQKLRARFKASAPELGLNKITINDLVLFAASRVLPLYPYMNAHKLGDTLRTFKAVHLGVAVSTPRGLMVPVLRNAETLLLSQISTGAKELAEACRNGAISPDDLHGSTLTVTNLGNTGIESFTPVINIPEVAILGVCGIQPKPVEVAPGQYEIQPCLGFSLTIDHAVVDGAPAAEFLKAFCGAIRDIDLWIAK